MYFEILILSGHFLPINEYMFYSIGAKVGEKCPFMDDMIRLL